MIRFAPSTNLLHAGSLAAAVLLLIDAPVRATFFTNGSGIPNPALVITFDEHSLADQTAIAGQYSDLGVSATSNLFFHNYPAGTHVNGNPDVLGNFIWNFNNAHTYASQFSISFVGEQTAAAFAISGAESGVTFEALQNGIVVDSGIANIGYGASDSSDFYGFSGVTFNEILVSYSGPGLLVADVDTIQLSAIPEPSTFILAALGGLALRIVRPRK